MRARPTFICGGDFTPADRDECPNPLHDWPLARGFIDASEQADRRLRNGWSNQKCPDCGLYGWRLGRKKHETDVHVPAGDANPVEEKS